MSQMGPKLRNPHPEQMWSERAAAGGGRPLRALRRALPTEDIVSAYGTAMCKSSRAGRMATGRLSNFAAAHNARQAWPPMRWRGRGLLEVGRIRNPHRRASLRVPQALPLEPIEQESPAK